MGFARGSRPVAENNKLSLESVQEILCVSDDKDLIELFEIVLSGNLKNAIAKYRYIISREVSPQMILTRFMDYIHFVSCLKSGIDVSEKDISEEVENRLKKISGSVNLASLSGIWQMLVRGADELRLCDRPEIAFEMILIRIIYASDFPDLHEFLKNLASGNLKQNVSVAEGKKTESVGGLNESKESESLLNDALKMFPNSEII